MSRDVEQILLLGDKTESSNALPFVRQRAKWFASLAPSLGFITRHIELRNGWALIKIRPGGRKLIIYTEVGGMAYEFLTSEGIDRNFLGSPPYNDGTPDGTWVCGRMSWHTFNRAKINSEPLVEYCGTCGSDPLTSPWPVVDGDDPSGDLLTKTPWAWQNQKSWEYAWWPNNHGRKVVLSAAGAVPGYSEVGRLSRFNYTNGSISKRYWLDTGFDLRPSVHIGKSGESIASGAPMLTSPSWYRRACLQVVDGRSFIVMADSEGAFHFWEAKNYPNREVDPGDYVTILPYYPSWVEEGLGLWSFNKDGTRAVCCPFRRTTPPQTESGKAIYKDAINGFFRVDPAIEPINNQLAYEDEPGLIEVEISITVHSNGSWSPAVSVSREERFSLTGRFYVAADYLFDDSRLGEPEDTLAIAHYDLWIKGGNYNELNQSNYYYPDDYSAITREALVIDVLDNGAWREYQRIVTSFDTLTEAVAASGQQWEIGGVPTTAHADTLVRQRIADFVYGAVVSGLSLRNMGWVIRHQMPTNWLMGNEMSLADEVFAYNASVETRGDADVLAAIPTWDTTGFQRADLSKLELWSNAYHASFEAYPTVGMSIHPAGHWAICTPVMQAESGALVYSDIVNYRIRGSDHRTTHKALYNDAFNDSRDYSDYRDLGLPEPTGKDAPLGTFRTFGIWREG